MSDDVIDRLSRAYDKVKPEPGMDGPHGGHIGGVTRQYIASAIEDAIEALVRAEPSRSSPDPDLTARLTAAMIELFDVVGDETSTETWRKRAELLASRLGSSPDPDLIDSLFGPSTKRPDESVTAFSLRLVQRDAAEKTLSRLGSSPDPCPICGSTNPHETHGWPGAPDHSWSGSSPDLAREADPK